MQAENLYTPNCLRTHTGRYINLLDPQPEDIMPFDIAIGLSRAARFAGHTKNFYSVAQHSVWCMQECERMLPSIEDLPFKVLMHDAHEFILCDIPSPLKNLMPEYAFIADKLQAVINKKFGITINEREGVLIKGIDIEAREWEWENKVLKGTGLRLNDGIAADEFIFNFIRLCKVPYDLK